MPAKALMPLHNKKLIEWTIKSMSSVNCDLKVILTTKDAKKYLKEIAKRHKFEIYCGDKNSVLKRFVDALSRYKVDTIIRATGDNPLLSSEITKETITLFENTNADICHLSNVPYGSGVEVIRGSALVEAFGSTSIPYHLEHVTPYIYENCDKFKVVIQDPKDIEITRKDVKISVDTRRDFERVNYLLREITNCDYSIKNIIKTYDRLNDKKQSRILIILDDNNKKDIVIEELINNFKDDYEIYYSIYHPEGKTTQNLEKQSDMTYIDFAKLTDFVGTNGIFESVIIFARDKTKKEIGYFNNFGFSIGVSYGESKRDLVNFNILIDDNKTNDKKNLELRYNLIDKDVVKIVEKVKNIIANLNVGLDYCPHCSRHNRVPIARDELWNMFKCPRCGLYYINPFNEYNDIYVDRYFTDEYKEQYGKTYEEDKPNILKFAQKRFDMIKKYKNSGRLLDFGCGLGFFCELAQNNGFETTSVDISDYAINYIKTKLNLDAIKGDLSFFEKNTKKYDVITSFYVIEHIKDFEKMIFMFYNNLNKNGVIALSTPNSSGVSIKFNFKEYCKVHPKDHYRIFSPKFLKKVLKSVGFKNIKIAITGIHPNRLVKNRLILKNSFFYKVIYGIMNLFKLGDTFEIYAQKR